MSRNLEMKIARMKRRYFDVEEIEAIIQSSTDEKEMNTRLDLFIESQE